MPQADVPQAGVTRKGDERGAMSEHEKLEAGLEYSLEDAGVAARKAEGVAALRQACGRRPE